MTPDSLRSPKREGDGGALGMRSGDGTRAGLRLYPRLGKRVLDVALVVLALPIVIPVTLLLAIVVRSVLGNPVFFVQQRPGYRDRLFAMWKFRSMSDARDETGDAVLSDAERLTPFGQFLRSYSLDELPELWNVLRGDMSLVGPRPLLPEYIPRYLPHQRRRHDVRPGITGWAQVNGRNALAWEERFELDVWYVDHCSLALDCRILWMTVRKVFARDGISQAGEATMKPFLGSKPD